MHKLLLLPALLLVLHQAQAQNADQLITVAEVERIEKILSADEMEGRGIFSPGIAKASAFIEAEFAKTGLQFMTGLNSYRQDFYMVETQNNTADVVIDGLKIADSNIAVIGFAPSLRLTEKDAVEILRIDSLSQLQQQFMRVARSKKNLLVLADTSLRRYKTRLVQAGSSSMDTTARAVVVVFGAHEAATYTLQLTNTLNRKQLNNVVGVLPGKTKAGEFVIFSGHYDHLGIGRPDATGDSIYNGANDDAAGITAVLLLAKYFKAMNNNERTLVFTAFTAEESGGYGSRYFSTHIDPAKVVAMFNIEMIGTESKWGTNSAYITGYEKTDMGKILEKNLAGSPFTFYPDPYPEQQLFYRSDNATLARLGVPAHTISTSKMDSEKYYHTQGDEIETLDMLNMAAIIRAIAASAASIVSGKDTPSRVDAADLQ